MDMMSIRRRVLLGSRKKVIYEGRNLVFDGTNFIDTGFAPYSEENIDKDFQITLIIKEISTNTVALNSIINAMYEAAPWPGFVLRLDEGYIRISGTKRDDGNIVKLSELQSYIGKSFIIRRINGKVSVILDGGNPVIPNSVARKFDNHLLIGCSEQRDNTKWRFFKGTIGYIRIEYI